ncbi:hypothetical protein FC40_GL001090 [Ligilactobacillus hayakitensis DSM 18933 = JCM 14209]|uniref:Uncharacterized protein n=1 Tax=Ligilactobacillus hayakitensis DSM 18933 = JCM 14209 TaxID=1423755 RepID=A0A0R1WIN7_9LACO|nr:hypothetical protein [Ligilactobacillus hayakitensis]KRM17882.1 hypothetical protein FC40_GL001090 [Ligilactobacillus hayakitensis DSM 18933 = JCM 14209]
MSEDVFFNPGQSISSSYDFSKAYVSAKIYHKKADNPVLIVQEKDGKPYVIFDEQAALKAKKDEAKRYSVIKRVTHKDLEETKDFQD